LVRYSHGISCEAIRLGTAYRGSLHSVSLAFVARALPPSPAVHLLHSISVALTLCITISSTLSPLPSPPPPRQLCILPIHVALASPPLLRISGYRYHPPPSIPPFFHHQALRQSPRPEPSPPARSRSAGPRLSPCPLPLPSDGVSLVNSLLAISNLHRPPSLWNPPKSPDGRIWSQNRSINSANNVHRAPTPSPSEHC
jgi:hypothetical protein